MCSFCGWHWLESRVGVVQTSMHAHQRRRPDPDASSRVPLPADLIPPAIVMLTVFARADARGGGRHGAGATRDNHMVACILYQRVYSPCIRLDLVQDQVASGRYLPSCTSASPAHDTHYGRRIGSVSLMSSGRLAWITAMTSSNSTW